MATTHNSETHKPTSETVENSELGRKYSSTPEEHLIFLLKLGYDPYSRLIQKYLAKHQLQLPTNENSK